MVSAMFLEDCLIDTFVHQYSIDNLWDTPLDLYSVFFECLLSICATEWMQKLWSPLPQFSKLFKEKIIFYVFNVFNVLPLELWCVCVLQHTKMGIWSAPTHPISSFPPSSTARVDMGFWVTKVCLQLDVSVFEECPFIGRFLLTCVHYQMYLDCHTSFSCILHGDLLLRLTGFIMSHWQGNITTLVLDLQ